jgi:type II secretory pathway component PulJ
MRLVPSKRRGFTLLDVVLAMVIAIGILITLLLFYRQAAEMRAQVLLEADRVAAIRLLLDRLTADLRSAYSDSGARQGLKGDETSLQFVRVELPPVAAWAKVEPGRVFAAPSDLKLVSYRSSTSRQGTNVVVSGLIRTEQPLVQPRILAGASSGSKPSSAQRPSRLRPPEPLTDAVRFLRFRYWDGVDWIASWNSLQLPQGVEVSLGTDPLPQDTLPEEYPFELFRRVIYLPGQSVSDDSSFLDDLFEEGPSETGGAP